MIRNPGIRSSFIIRVGGSRRAYIVFINVVARSLRMVGHGGQVDDEDWDEKDRTSIY